MGKLRLKEEEFTKEIKTLISPRLLMMARLLLGHIMPLQSGVFLRTAMEMNLVRDVTVAVR